MDNFVMLMCGTAAWGHGANLERHCTSGTEINPMNLSQKTLVPIRASITVVVEKII